MKKELNIFGDIVSESWHPDDVTLSKVKSQIDGLTAKDELIININCYGGEVFEAVAISNIIADCQALKAFNVLGICASAATMLFKENDDVEIRPGAMLMYHKPLVGCIGNADDFRKQIERLDKIELENIINPLSYRSKKTADELAKLIAGEWWLNSDEAVLNLGFKPSRLKAVENNIPTKQMDIYKNFIEKRKALTVNAYSQFINHKKQLKK